MGTIQPVPTPPGVQFGAHLDVPFDPVALESQRRTFRRLLTFIACMWAVVLVVTAVAGIYTLNTSGEFFMLGLMITLVALGPIFVFAAIQLAMAIVNRGRASLWLLTPPAPGVVALRLSATGVWVGTTSTPGGASYAWGDLQRVRLTIFRRDKVVAVVPVRGVQPDRSVLVGFEGLLDPLAGVRSFFGIRGPRVPIRSLAVPVEVVRSAVHHYSGGQFRL